MWSKFTNVLRSKPTLPAQQDNESPADASSKQHPNLSVFHAGGDPSSTNQDGPESSSKRGILRRLSRQALNEGDSAKSVSSLRAPGFPKKVRPQANFNTVSSGSQLSFDGPASASLTRSNSSDMLASSRDPNRPPSRSSVDVLRRPSLDILRNEQPPRSSQEGQRPNIKVDTHVPPTPSFVERTGSVRSILRDPNTPGTGQNVRFFSRDAYKVISPEHSMDTDSQPFISAPLPKDNSNAFMENLQKVSTSTPAVRHGKSHSKSSVSSRPSVSEIFSPLFETNDLPSTPAKEHSGSDMSLSSPGGNSSIFDMSQQLDIHFDPPGLGFNADAPVYDRSLDLDSSFNQSPESNSSLPYSRSTSTPPREPKEIQKDAAALPHVVDETIFHSDEISQRLSAPLHERTQSFTLGRSVFYPPDTQKSEDSSGYPSGDLRQITVSTNASSASATKSRARAISDSMLQNMLRGSPKPPPPEADINDEGGEQVQVYSPPPVPEPDPFSAHASTYYTPQVNIPMTPPKSISHVRKTSKEENLIYSLQAQLSLQTELCQQYEADLRARDELVELLGKKVAEAAEKENQRQATVRQWKKRVSELQKVCRHLEEEVDSSRQASMERSIMDEASGEALRMLHRQIAALERDKADQEKREHRMQEEVETLEVLVKEKSEEVSELKQILWNRDESEREISQGIRDVKAQVDDMGNVSMAYFDATELRRLGEEREHAAEEERARHHVAEVAWQQEKEELMVQAEGLLADKTRCEEDLENARQQLKTRDEEFEMLRSELEAQWTHTEDMTTKINELEKLKLEVEQDRDELRHHVEDLEARIDSMEVEWNESENRKNELEAEMEEMLRDRSALEQDRAQQEQERIDALLRERDDKISQLEHEAQLAHESNSRLQDGDRERDEQIGEFKERVQSSEREAASLRQEVATLRREYNRLLDEQSRIDHEVSINDNDLRGRLEAVTKQKTESEVEVKAARDQVAALKDEVDRLRRHLHVLQQESADKEVKMTQLDKKLKALSEDNEGLNIALGSKQQELDLMKRQHGVRGTAGMTPAHPPKPSKRRDSQIFDSTPMPRPSSRISDTEGTVRKAHERRMSVDRPPSAASRPISALSRGTRANSAATSISANGSKTGSTAPPAGRKHSSSISSVSGAGSPTPRPNKAADPSRALSPTGTPLPKKKVSSAVSALEQRAAGSTASTKPRPNVGRLPSSRVTSPVTRVEEVEEKENVSEDVGMVSASARRRVLVPS